MTRAARREAREAEQRRRGRRLLGSFGRVVRGHRGCGRWRCGRCHGVGRARRRRDDGDESERIASAADFRDDVPADTGRRPTGRLEPADG